ncbi:cytochrome p450 82a3 [Nicotiana attenuata]|uniref:Cytochrome p450 82a3 n=1 Tax=Nicotiana attenuata TaxID=49451 RepID=A0A1J6I0A3_NICAT|nr:cytochrome p450 82a3 [Nicotiana attenuata]
MDFLLIAITLASSIVFLFALYFSTKRNNRQRKTVPEAAGAWPIIGHLHLLSGTESDQLPHKVLARMAEKYGPIFGLKFGVYKVVVGSNHKIEKECFTTNDLALANRPNSLASEIIGYNHAMFGVAPYGPYWREIRKIATIEFLSTRRIEMLKHIREFEVKSAIKETYNYWLKNKSGSLNGAVKMEMKEWLGNVIMNIMVKIVYLENTTRKNEAELDKQVTVILTEYGLLGLTVDRVKADCHRWKENMDRLAADKEAALSQQASAETQLRGIKVKNLAQAKKIEELEANLAKAGVEVAEAKAEVKKTKATTDKTISALQLAGIDTMIVTLSWTLSLLLNYKTSLNNYQTLKKARDELDVHVGKHRWVQESDIKNLVYLQAIVKEALRLYPVAPLLLPYESIEDCVISGYDIPKGTRLLVNIWKILCDPDLWPNPDELKPERFLTTHKDVDVRGNHFELIPFGSGRRMCPGTSMGLQVVQYVLAVLLQGFEMKRPSDEPIDMSESFGSTILKASPLEILLAPHLASNLYE